MAEARNRATLTTGINALGTRASTAVADEQELVTCMLDDVEFGLSIHAVREIIRMPRITPVPTAPRYVRGLTNLRGNILPVIEPRLRFGMRGKSDDTQCRVLVVELNGAPTGLIVDAVREVLRVDSSDIEPAPATVQGVDSQFLQGVVKLDEGKRLVMLIDQDKVTDQRGVDVARVKHDAVARSSHSSRGATDVATDQDNERFVTFWLANEEYGFPIMDVQEIIRIPWITPVPNAPVGVEGITSLRQRVLPVMDLRALFGLRQTQDDIDATCRTTKALDTPANRDNERCLVVRAGSMAMALRIDKINEVLQVPKSAIEPTPEIVAGQGPSRNRIRGVAKLDNGRRLIMSLDTQRLITRADLDAIESVVRDHGAPNGSGQGESFMATRAETDARQLVSFRVGAEEFATDIMQVQEIIRLEKVTAVPHAPAFVEGMVNLRGQVLPVLDLRRRFGMEARPYDDATRVVVVDINNRKTGIIVDTVSEVLRLPLRSIESAPAVTRVGHGNDFIAGVGKLNGGDRMILILKTDRLLSDEELSSLDESVAGKRADDAAAAGPDSTAALESSWRPEPAAAVPLTAEQTLLSWDNSVTDPACQATPCTM